MIAKRHERQTGRRCPIVSLVVLLPAICAQMYPALAAWFEYDRAALAGGQAWRLITCHLTHWTFDHFLWDAVAFLALAAWCELKNRSAMLACLAMSSLSIPLTLAWLMPELTNYRGLSGLDSALFVLAAGLMIQHSLAEGRRGRVVLIGVSLVAFLAKTGFEYVSGDTIFVDSQAAAMMPVPLAHVVGGLAGLLIALLATSKRALAGSDRFAAPFARANANAVVQRQNEDLPVSDLA